MTRRLRILSRVVLAGDVFSLLLGVRPPAPAAAAGAGNGLPYSLFYAFPPSHYNVPSNIAKTLYGEYVVKAIDQSSHLNDGNAYIVPRDPNSPIGIVQFYGREPPGLQTSWYEVLTNFRLVAHNTVQVDLYNQSGQYIGDQMRLTRTTSGDLVGKLFMEGTSYSINWRKLVAR